MASSAIQSMGIKEPHPHDVLCGRGGTANNHVGNVHYRTIVEANKRLYHKVEKFEKMLVALSIVQVIQQQSPPGRFLAKMSNNDGDELWYDIGDAKARDKTSQALREGANEVRLTMKYEEEGGLLKEPSPSTKLGDPEESKTSAQGLKSSPHHSAESLLEPSNIDSSDFDEDDDRTDSQIFSMSDLELIQGTQGAPATKRAKSRRTGAEVIEDEPHSMGSFQLPDQVRQPGFNAADHTDASGVSGPDSVALLPSTMPGAGANVFDNQSPISPSGDVTASRSIRTQNVNLPPALLLSSLANAPMPSYMGATSAATGRSMSSSTETFDAADLQIQLGQVDVGEARVTEPRSEAQEEKESHATDDLSPLSEWELKLLNDLKETDDDDGPKKIEPRETTAGGSDPAENNATFQDQPRSSQHSSTLNFSELAKKVFSTDWFDDLQNTPDTSPGISTGTVNTADAFGDDFFEDFDNSFRGTNGNALAMFGGMIPVA